MEARSYLFISRMKSFFHTMWQESKTSRLEWIRNPKKMLCFWERKTLRSTNSPTSTTNFNIVLKKRTIMQQWICSLQFSKLRNCPTNIVIIPSPTPRWSLIQWKIFWTWNLHTYWNLSSSFLTSPNYNCLRPSWSAVTSPLNLSNLWESQKALHTFTLPSSFLCFRTCNKTKFHTITSPCKIFSSPKMDT